MKSDKMIISKYDIIKAPAGHPVKIGGTGLHRDWKKQPKGGRSAQNKKAIKDSI